MAFLLKLFKGAAKHKREYPNIRQGTDPLEQWQKIGELGDGSFGKVFKVRVRTLTARRGRVVAPLGRVALGVDDQSPAKLLTSGLCLSFSFQVEDDPYASGPRHHG